MVNEYKRIVLLKGLTLISDHHFHLFKSLLANDLKLERNRQEKYTRVEIADMMEDEFPDDAGLSELVKFCEGLPALRKRAEILKTERSKVIAETSLEMNSQEAGPATPTSTTSHMLASQRGETSTAQAETSTAQKRKSMSKEETGVKKTKASNEPDQPPCSEEPTATCQNQKSQPQNLNISRGAVLKMQPLTVMVLKASDPFEYESPEQGVQNMFHATVATVNQHFHVKVFNIDLKEKFTKNNFIIISNYFESKGILEISKESSVKEAAPAEKIEVPNSIIRKANVSPKICDIRKGAAGAVFYGLFTLHKIKVNPKNTIYEIKDGSGSMEVVGNGKWYNIHCKEGDNFRLFCFHLKTINGQPKLVCGDHSFIKVTRAGKKKEESTAQSSTKK